RTCDGCAACSPERGAAVSPSLFALSAADVPASKANISTLSPIFCLSGLCTGIRSLCCLSRLYIPTVCTDATTAEAGWLSYGNGHCLWNWIKAGFARRIRFNILCSAGCCCSYHIIEWQPAIQYHIDVCNPYLYMHIRRPCWPLS